ncbi:ERF family protein [Pontibaca methylaminivorans]|uniref:ERF superfamily protein n=1 Tax=Pontibaca methylaminivorans TaxID=515897 RepID=A0A1R3WC64_9RHOB|nr:ERF family protein [Pontibaca methylaminivorans]SIT74633.1 ERF superfamily protein [Pontibaca methylaminivorans]
MSSETGKREGMSVHQNIYCALAAAQMEFGTVAKGSVNPAFKSRYADLADVAAVVIPVLARHGVAVLHYMAGDNVDRMRTEFVHGASETRVHCDVPLLVDRKNMQGMKSATTYAKRIGLESLSGVAPEDDDGNEAAKAPPVRQARPQADRQQGPVDVDVARDSLAKADTLDRLQAIWEALPGNVRACISVTNAKDARKAALSGSVLADDEIPY